MAQLVYITSDSRSGSTLLDLLVGNHPDCVSTGELRSLGEHYRGDYVCTCRARVRRCDFWQSVDRELRGQSLSLDRVRTLPPGGSNQLSDLAWYLPLGITRVLARWRPKFAETLRVARSNLEIVDAIGEAAGKRFVVDSSKVVKLASLYVRLRSHDVNVIFLTRDGRGVCCSRFRRNPRDFRGYVVGWCGYVVKSLLLRAVVTRRQSMTIKYEELCRSPETTLRAVCRFLGIDFVPEMVALEMSGKHNIGGSPMRFDASVSGIHLDDSWRGRLTETQLRQFRLYGGALCNFILGYGER